MSPPRAAGAPRYWVIRWRQHTGEVEARDLAPVADAKPRRTFWDMVNEPFAVTQAQIEAWWPTRRRD